MRDIAKALQVATSTVSSVLSGKTVERRISEKTRQQILSYAAQCGYQPNMIARSLRTGETRVIGMLVEDVANPFFAAIIKNVERILVNSDYELFCSSSENNLEKAIALLNAYKERRVDGYIIAPMDGLEPMISELIDRDIPVVLFDSYIPSLKAYSIVVGNFNGTYEATRHLQRNGYVHIAFMTVDINFTHLEERAAGYVKAMAEQGTTTFIAKITHHVSAETRLEEIARFLTNYPQVEAVIFGTNYLTVSGLQAIRKIDSRIPQDIAVVSFDDIEYFQLVTPGITTIAQPVESYAKEITAKLMDGIRKRNKKVSVMVLKTVLIERGSSAPKFLSNAPINL